MNAITLGPPWPVAAAVAALIGVVFVVALRLRRRGRNLRTYDAGLAWLRAASYFSFAWALALVTGAVSTIVDNPIVLPGQTSNAWWWVLTVVAFMVIFVGYWIIWPIGTQAHGRHLVMPDTPVFGALWGVSEGMIFASVWTTAVRVFGRDDLAAKVAVFVASYIVLSLFVGLWHAVFWDVYVAPEHNILEWNIRKVIFCHNPNVIITTAYVTIFGNLAIYVGLQAFALFGATLAMPFPSFRMPNPSVDPDIPPRRDMSGVTCVVTGIGAPTADNIATDLAEAGATVVLVGRDSGAVSSHAARIARWTGRTMTELVADLSSSTDVQRVARECESLVGHVDVLVDDASDATAETAAARLRGGAQLERLLAEARTRGEPLRVVVMGSESHRRASAEQLDDLISGATSDEPTVQAGRVAYALELARRSDADRVAVQVVAPGAMVGAGSAANSEPSAVSGFFSTIFQSNLDPARTCVDLATVAQMDPPTGGYWTNGHADEPGDVVADQAMRARLWRWAVGGVESGRAVNE